MKKIVMILVVLLLVGCQSNSEDQSSLTVAVSIVPQETFVKAVAGDLVDVVVMIPPGASPTNYQPTPKQMQELSQASVYFGIDVPAEGANILPALSSINDQMMVIDLADGVDAQYPARFFVEEDLLEDEVPVIADDHQHEGRDPHIWMSPKRVVVMIQAIRDVLIQVDPDHAETYSKNATSYIEELVALDQQLMTSFELVSRKEFVVMHPSLGYFADDYGLEMVAIEKDGKEASVSHLQEVIDYCREYDVQVVFYQTEFDATQANTIADEIGGRVEAFEPLSGDYINKMYQLMATFKETLTE